MCEELVIFWALEIVKNRITKEPFNTKADKFTGQGLMTDKISKEAFENGLFIGTWYDSLIIAPPLIVSQKEIEEAVAILDKSLEIADREVVSTGVGASRSSEFA